MHAVALYRVMVKIYFMGAFAAPEKEQLKKSVAVRRGAVIGFFYAAHHINNIEAQRGHLFGFYLIQGNMLQLFTQDSKCWQGFAIKQAAIGRERHDFIGLNLKIKAGYFILWSRKSFVILAKI